MPGPSGASKGSRLTFLASASEIAERLISGMPLGRGTAGAAGSEASSSEASSSPSDPPPNSCVDALADGHSLPPLVGGGCPCRGVFEEYQDGPRERENDDEEL